MRKLINSKSGSSNCPKWSNANPGSDSESEDEIHSAPANSTETAHSPNHEDNENQTGQGNITRRVSEEAETMYRAAMEGDWIAAEILLSRNPNLACDFVTDEDDRSLHVAVAMKHKKFVEKLVDMMDEDDLVLRDGRGYTACCYAAVSGAVEIARVMIEKNPNLATAHDENNVTPLHKAAMCGKKKMVSYLLESTEIENLSNEEWFDLLLVTIRERMFDVAIELVEKNKVLAMMVKEERTALHVLAQMDDVSNIPSNFVKLAEKLWDEMQKMEKISLLQLLKTQHILHDAAKAGHVELLTMVTRAYPQLTWDTDSNGHTIFHIAVAHRQRRVFNLIHPAETMIHTRTISQDQDGNNILHLSAKLSPRPLDITRLPPATLMQSELAWFEVIKAMVPPSCQNMRNADGLTPRELFSKEHKRLLRDSKTWMMNSADSYMLIGTILFSVLFAGAFNVPGGYDSQTGKAIFLKSESLQTLTSFQIFYMLDFIALALSAISILLFGSIMTSRFAEYDFHNDLPSKMFLGLTALFWSLISAVTAFTLSFQLVSGALPHPAITCFMFIFLCVIQIGILRKQTVSTVVMKSRPSRHTLFNQHPSVFVERD
ncbi:hypothetical protein C2S52_001905 [Perilla frutescens var. hirtella]|nr:hypothetical protein C2S52_001905 [Perilla frutescens var. hirtella]